MSIPADLEREVRQLDNDVSSIYELLTDVDTGVRKVQAAQLRQGSRLDKSRTGSPGSTASSTLCLRC